MTVTQRPPEAVVEAIRADQTTWQQSVAISRRTGDSFGRIAAFEREHVEQDLVRTMMMKLFMTEEEVAARYERAWSAPFSVEYIHTGEVDEDGEEIFETVPLDEARVIAWRYTAAPRKWPLPGAVYTVAVPFDASDGLLTALTQALRALSIAHPDLSELRLGHQDYCTYRNKVVGHGPYPDDGRGVTFGGMPLTLFPRIPTGTLVAVFPLEG